MRQNFSNRNEQGTSADVGVLILTKTSSSGHIIRIESAADHDHGCCTSTYKSRTLYCILATTSYQLLHHGKFICYLFDGWNLSNKVRLDSVIDAIHHHSWADKLNGGCQTFRVRSSRRYGKFGKQTSAFPHYWGVNASLTMSRNEWFMLNIQIIVQYKYEIRMSLGSNLESEWMQKWRFVAYELSLTDRPNG